MGRWAEPIIIRAYRWGSTPGILAEIKDDGAEEEEEQEDVADAA